MQGFDQDFPIGKDSGAATRLKIYSQFADMALMALCQSYIRAWLYSRL